MRKLSLVVALFLPLAFAAKGQQSPTPPKEPVFDPFRAAKSIEVGRYYMKRGNYDAAIERFQDAARHRPNFALPYRLIGEAYEKKGFKPEARDAYRKYLELLPQADDAEKIRKRIARLTRDLEREARRR